MPNRLIQQIRLALSADRARVARFDFDGTLSLIRAGSGSARATMFSLSQWAMSSAPLPPAPITASSASHRESCSPTASAMRCREAPCRNRRGQQRAAEETPSGNAIVCRMADPQTIRIVMPPSTGISAPVMKSFSASAASAAATSSGRPSRWSGMRLRVLSSTCS